LEADRQRRVSLPFIDWQQPWLAPWRERGERVARAVGRGVPLHHALNEESRLYPASVLACASAGDVCGQPARASDTGATRPAIRFAPQSALPPGEPYERYIFSTQECPVREGLHDFFNGLCWLQFPHTKQALNALQAAAIARDGVSSQRGPLRDAITVLDENAAFFMAPADVADQLWPALQARDWPQLFGPLRSLWRQTQPILFGHALLEKLVVPRKPLTAHVLLARFAVTSIAQLDTSVAAVLCDEFLSNKPFTPLQVLGVPGWWAANEAPEFYNDPKVFRVVP
jgi:hypothetical protein